MVLQGYTKPAMFYNVKEYGARGDGKKYDTEAINKTIAVAAAAGGGTVYFPAGTYLSYTIHLQNNITLFIDQGAAIVAGTPVNGAGFDSPEPDSPTSAYQDYAHGHWKTGFIVGIELHNIAIIGHGMIWGKGLEHVTDKTIPAGGGNMAIALKLCKNVTIKDITILHGGHFGILATGVDNLTIDNIKIDTNRDGMDIDCCRHVSISNCNVNSPHDDGICLKSSFGLGFARATENVTITNCHVSGYEEGSLLDGTYKRNIKSGRAAGSPTGRIKMGTESNGGFKNIAISNCVFDYCRGLALETVDGGLLEDVTISNITMRDIVNAPIFLRLGMRMRGPKDAEVGVLRRVTISNINVYNADRQAVIISGVPGHDIEDVRLSNIKLYYNGGGTKEQAMREVPELETGYPEPGIFGTLPAYGFFIRHVKNIQLENIEVNLLTDDKRPCFILNNVSGADFRFVKSPGAANTLVLKNTADISLFQSFNRPDKSYKNSGKEEL